MLRTQIYLPEKLKKDIDRERSLSGESMADYLRKAAEEKLERTKKKKAKLKKLAEDFIGSSKRSDREIQEWLDSIRAGRRLADEVREERLQKTLKKALNKK